MSLKQRATMVIPPEKKSHTVTVVASDPFRSGMVLATAGVVLEFALEGGEVVAVKATRTSDDTSQPLTVKFDFFEFPPAGDK